jgi:SAM-dependent methyltransferase
MCHGSCIKFGYDCLTSNIVNPSKILEIGSLNVNGSLRANILKLKPVSYTGVDIVPGKDVDLICNVTNLLKTFRENSFEIVLATELLEHVFSWKSAVSNIKALCKPNGYILITTRSPGFPYHCYPNDYWRYTVENFSQIFSDLRIIKLHKDPHVLGVFLFAQKPLRFSENNLSSIKVFRIKKP